jgi:hypothetical protein
LGGISELGFESKFPFRPFNPTGEDGIFSFQILDFLERKYLISHAVSDSGLSE